MPEVPYALIRQLQTYSRAAAGLSAYDPEDATLPTLPPLAATIAALEPSQPDISCVNCKGKLLRGSQSNICVYCGCRPQIDATPEPICFTSTTGYQWLLRSVHLDGSDATRGVYQSRDDLWRKVVDIYNSEKPNEMQERNVRSLQCRWSIITKEVGKFRGCVRQVESFNVSGAKEETIMM